jgi:pSer/pThr/pTyr-binding forkhead associated (FHA) protein
LSTFRPRDAASEQASAAQAEGAPWTLRFISGKYQGGEFPLRPNREIVIGRSSDLDMVLVEDMVSRKHAKIVTDGKVVSIQDLGSTNGTFVNGEKIRNVQLKDGDRILVGTSIIKLVAGSGEVRAPAASLSEIEARSKLQVTASRRVAPKSMSGNIEEIPLPDLLQLLSTSRKSGVLVLRSEWGTGRLHLRKGQIYFANIDESFDVTPRKAMFRMLTWNQGLFELEGDDLAAAVAAFGAEVDDPVGGLDDFEIVLDHHHRVAVVDQLVQHFQQLAHVVEMQAGGRLVEDVERAAGGAARQFLRQLDALRLAARQRRRLLADMDVAEADASASPASRGSTAPP